MKRALTLMLAVMLLLLCGCAKSPDSETLPPTEPQTEATTVPTQPPTQPTEPPVVETINPLTGEPVEALTTNRAYAVAINNSKGAMPQQGVAQADILYEMLIEGETRCMGVFYDLASVTEPLGSVRSARRDFIRVAMAYDAIFVHNGWSYNQGTQYDKYSAESTFNQFGWEHIDGNKNASNYFYRDWTGKSSVEHTLYVKPEKILEAADNLGLTTTRDKSLDVGLKFDEEAFFVGETAGKVKVWFNMSKTTNERWHKYTTLTYNQDTGLYEAYQSHSGYSGGADYIDGNTGEVLSFRNILVLRTPNEELQNASHWMKIDVVGSGEGFFACNGQIIPIKWSRAAESDPYTYTLENGTPITLGVGKTYIAIVPTTGVVEYN